MASWLGAVREVGAVDEFAKLEQEAISPVVAVELNAAEARTVERDRGDLFKRRQQAGNFKPGVLGQRWIAVEDQQCRLQDSILEDVVAEFVIGAFQLATLPSLAAGAAGEVDAAADARGESFMKNIGTIHSAPEQLPDSMGEDSGKKSVEIGAARHIQVLHPAMI